MGAAAHPRHVVVRVRPRLKQIPDLEVDDESVGGHLPTCTTQQWNVERVGRCREDGENGASAPVSRRSALTANLAVLSVASVVPRYAGSRTYAFTVLTVKDGETG